MRNNSSSLALYVILAILVIGGLIWWILGNNTDDTLITDDEVEVTDPDMMLNGTEEQTDITPDATDTTDAQATVVAVRQDPELGPYLVDGEGLSLYMFESDTTGTGATTPMSTCAGACAEVWPPLIGTDVSTSNGVQTGMITTFTREDGRDQVVYNGWPLYYYAPDEEPGDTLGQDLSSFGAKWFLIAPNGEVIDGTAAGS